MQGAQPSPNATPRRGAACEARARGNVHAALRLQERHPAHEREPHEDHHHAEDAADDVKLALHLRAERRHGNAEHDEHRGEAGYEQQHADHQPRPRALGGHVRTGHAAHVTQVAGNERDARTGRRSSTSPASMAMGIAARSEPVRTVPLTMMLTTYGDGVGVPAAPAASVGDFSVDGSASPMTRAYSVPSGRTTSVVGTGIDRDLALQLGDGLTVLVVDGGVLDGKGALECLTGWSVVPVVDANDLHVVARIHLAPSEAPRSGTAGKRRTRCR